VKSHNNLHPQVCSLENVMAAARTASHGKMSGAAAARCHARWQTHAVRLHEEPTSMLPTLALISSGLLLRRRGKISL
jgi:hypothetical protein